MWIYTHPTQYFSPLLRLFAQQKNFETEVLYCSDKSAQKFFDKQFNRTIQWDTPLLKGYNFKILPNYSSIESGFWSFFNPTIVKELWARPKGVLIVHGWGYSSLVVGLLWGKILGHKVCLRAESPLLHEYRRSISMRMLRKIIFKFFLFSWIDYFCFIGNQNRLFYKYYGVSDRKLIFTPYSVDNSQFLAYAEGLEKSRASMRESLGIPENSRVAIFCGKFIYKKRPMDLLRAFFRVKQEDAYLVMIGEGELREEMEAFCRDNNLDKVIITGFVNQSVIPFYYSAGDFFVMCSDIGETWGLATNEAMNFGLPVLLSDMTGCREDLLREGENGFGFPTGDIDALSSLLVRMYAMPIEKIKRMGRVSKDIVSHYNHQLFFDNISKTFFS